MKSNLTSLTDESGERYDWIELYNDNDSVVDLEGYFLSDDTADIKKWQFESCLMEPHSYMLVWASNKDIKLSMKEPNAIDGLQVWFNAESIDLNNDSSVFVLDNKYYLKSWSSSVNNYTSFQKDSNSLPQVIPNGLNGKPVVRFDGIDDFLDSDFTPPQLAEERTIFIMINNTDLENKNQQSNNYFLHYGSYGSDKCYGILFKSKKKGSSIGNGYYGRYEYGSFKVNDKPHFISTVYDGEVDRFFVDRTLAYTNSVVLKTGDYQKLRIGSKMGKPTDFLGGDVAEILVYDRVLSDNERTAVEGYLASKYGMSHIGNHTNFKLTKKDVVQLSYPNGRVCSIVEDLDIPDDWSIGLNSNEEYAKYQQVTPLEINKEKSYLDIADKLSFSHSAGFYTDDITLELAANKDEKIYYTLDGSVPTENSYLYTEPIQLTDVSRAPNRLSLIRTTLVNEGFHTWYEPDDTVYKFNTVRARVYKDDYFPSEIVTRSYVVDKDYKDQFKYPVVSLVTDSLNFFDDSIGIHVAGANIDSSDYESTNFYQAGMEWERPVHLEVFSPGGMLRLSQNSGIRIHGGFTRTANIKSLRLYARKMYGDSDFDIQLFPDDEQDSFKRFILRNSGNDYAWAYMRDVLMQELVKGLPIETQNCQIAEVYLNGEFWGIEYIRERFDKHYIEENYGINGPIDMIENDMEVSEGSENHFSKMKEFIKDNDMSDSINFAYVNTQMDCENYMYYLATNMFYAQTDWPQNNIKYWRNRTDAFIPDTLPGHDGRWRWLLFDTDYGFGRVDPYDFNIFDRLFKRMTGWSVTIMTNLLGTEDIKGNSKFRQQFISTLADLMNANFREEYVLENIDSLQALLSVKIEEHIERWKTPGSMRRWYSKIDVIREFAQYRPLYMRQHMVEFFDEIEDTVLLTLNTNAVMGAIKVNRLLVNGSTKGVLDPENPFPWNGVYFKGVPVTLKAIPNPGYVFVGWEGGSNDPEITVDLNQASTYKAVFKPADVRIGALRINEYYKNADTSWVELYNTSAKTIVLDDISLTNGNSTYQYPYSTIAPGEYLVACVDTFLFNDKYSYPLEKFDDVPPSIFDSDKIALVNKYGVVLDDVTLPDSGKTLNKERVYDTKTDTIPVNWQDSYANSGTPGFRNSTSAYALVINEFMASNSSVVETGEAGDWIEIYNPLDEAVDLAGLYLTDKVDKLSNYCQIPSDRSDSTTIGPKSFALFWADKNPEAGVRHLDIKLSSEGEQVALISNDGEFVIDSLSFKKQMTDVSFGRRYDASPKWKYFIFSTPEASNGKVQANAEGVEEGFTLFPNPATIETVIMTDDVVTVKLFNLMGEEQVITSDLNNYNFNTINVSGLPQGLYMVVVETKTSKFTKQLVVE